MSWWVVSALVQTREESPDLVEVRRFPGISRVDARVFADKIADGRSILIEDEWESRTLARPLAVFMKKEEAFCDLCVNERMCGHCVEPGRGGPALDVFHRTGTPHPMEKI